jgi:hypothetical protein
MIYTFEQITEVVLRNPNKRYIEKGKEAAKKAMLHVYGQGMTEAIKRCEYFENEPLHGVRKQYAISNKDLFGRLLQQEDMVFTAKGGSSSYNLPESLEQQMSVQMEDVSFGLSLRKWIRNFALPAYRVDPMAIIFIEIDSLSVNSEGNLSSQPKAYPTYKSIFCIYDYLTNGRKLEYVCFRLSVGEALQFGIQDEELRKLKPEQESSYFRFVDDAKDLIVQKKEDRVALVTNITQQNPLPNDWGRTPGFVISDLIQFNDPQCFVSPLDLVIELADCFLHDRSVRDLQKRYHGFSKAVEPLLMCGTCQGAKYVGANACPDCTPPGGEPTGYKLKTKPADVVRFPLSVFEQGSGFDFKRVFGYVTPDVEGWEKQDASLEDIEEKIEMTYWGTVRMKRPKPGNTGESITATESDSNQAPKEARLNITADWAEKTETLVSDFLGEYWYETAFKKSSIAYGRDYILKTPEELMEFYQQLRTKGAPDFALDEALEKYYQARYQNNPTQLAKYLKMLDVEPFPHIAIAQAKGIITDFIDFNAKLYFGEWSNTIPDGKWISTPAPKLREELRAYVEAKGIEEPAPEQPKPTF